MMQAETAAQALPPATGHPRDTAQPDLSDALATADRPDLLVEMVRICRQTFGFFSRFTSHTLTYPWVAEQLETLPAGTRALDIGAGLNPMPLFLAGKGVSVECVDGHSEVRTPPVADNWTEWGFFDYGPLDPKLRSHHLLIQDYAPSELFDAVYAICVLTHMPRSVRELAIERSHQWLCDGGRMVLAFDLLAGTNYLWNRQKAHIFAPMEEHGSLGDVLTHVSATGFRVDQVKILRGLPRGRPDLFMLAAAKHSLQPPAALAAMPSPNIA